MTTQPYSDSSLFEFFDSFLQEKNIKWVLATGMLILLGSSLMMVMPHWQTLEPTWKFLTIVGYTSAVFAAGWWSYHKLALRRTGTTLLSLTVLLIPVCFMAWQWTWSAADSLPGRLTAGILLGLSLCLATAASRLTFRHFLHGDQPTLIVSYLVLSLAGAIGPSIRDTGPVGSWMASLALWGVFSIGAVKANRHVFWLTEERSQPRVFGFFPVLLLGGQFLGVFAANFASTMSVDWMGFGCVLVAIPVLLTADTVAKVFQERTGNVVRPIPWPIMLPFTVGLLLCVAGVVVAGMTLPHRVPYALVPTATLVAGLMAITARRTNHAAFVWAMLAGVVVAYNFSPIFFQSAARAAVAHSAAAVQEARLPFAFYGLTYLPLVLVMSGVAVWVDRRGSKLFARPIRQFCVGISLLLLAASVGHVKALFPVASAMLGVFTFQAKLFRDRRLALVAIIAFLIAAAGVSPFVEQIFAIPLPAAAIYFLSLTSAVILLAASPWLDLRIQQLPLKGFDPRSSFTPCWVSMCQTMSLGAAILVAVVWTLRSVTSHTEFAPLVTLIALGLLLVHSLIWTRPAVSWFTYAFAACELAHYAIDYRLPVDSFTTLVSVLLGSQWAGMYLLARQPNHRVSLAWAEVNQKSAWVGLMLSTVMIGAPDLVLGTLRERSSLFGLCRGLLFSMWCFDATRRLRHWSAPIGVRSMAQSAMTAVGCLGILGVVSSSLVLWQGLEAQSWIPVAWALTAIATLPLVRAWHQRWRSMEQAVVLAEDYHACRVITLTIEAVQCIVFGYFAALHLVEYSASVRLAGYLGIGGLLAMSLLRERRFQRQIVIAIANWSMILTVAHWCAPQASNLFDYLLVDLGLAPWCVAALASVSELLWLRQSPTYLINTNQISDSQRMLLRTACLGSLLFSLNSSVLSPVAIVLAGGTFALLIAVELRAACLHQNVTRVWIAELLGGLACLYFLWFRVISFGRGWSMFVILGVGALIHLAGLFAAKRSTLAILSRPLTTTGLWMPLATVGVGVFRHLNQGNQVVWHGMNSLAILLAGGFYFWQAVEQRSKRFTLLSAAILNIALALLWRELEFSDPQFYLVPVGISLLTLVQILKREIPSDWHDPLRYAGALTILVSPTFHIVHGSWLHLFTLMTASTAVLLVAIGLRVRALMYAGVGFLVADLCGMVIFGCADQPNLLWIAGIGFGAAIVTLGAACEHNREKLLQRLRVVSAQLEQWE